MTNMNPLLKIPFISRVLHFAVDFTPKLLSLSHVHPTWEEAIIHFESCGKYLYQRSISTQDFFVKLLVQDILKAHKQLTPTITELAERFPQQFIYSDQLLRGKDVENVPFKDAKDWVDKLFSASQNLVVPTSIKKLLQKVIKFDLHRLFKILIFDFDVISNQYKNNVRCLDDPDIAQVLYTSFLCEAINNGAEKIITTFFLDVPIAKEKIPLHKEDFEEKAPQFRDFFQSKMVWYQSQSLQYLIDHSETGIYAQTFYTTPLFVSIVSFPRPDIVTALLNVKDRKNLQEFAIDLRYEYLFDARPFMLSILEMLLASKNLENLKTLFETQPRVREFLLLGSSVDQVSPCVMTDWNSSGPEISQDFSNINVLYLTALVHRPFLPTNVLGKNPNSDVHWREGLGPEDLKLRAEFLKLFLSYGADHRVATADLRKKVFTNKPFPKVTYLNQDVVGDCCVVCKETFEYGFLSKRKAANCERCGILVHQSPCLDFRVSVPRPKEDRDTFFGGWKSEEIELQCCNECKLEFVLNRVNNGGSGSNAKK